MARGSLRERKKQQTRVDLIRAAVDLFHERGYETTTVDDIVDAANYSRSTFFRYFGSKEDVVFGDLPERLERIRAVLEEEGGHGDPWGVARRVITEDVLSFVESSGEELEEACVTLWFSEPALQRRYVDIILQWEQLLAAYFAAAWGVNVSTDVQSQTYAVAMIGVGRTAVGLRLGGIAAVARVLEEGFDLLEKGLGAPRRTERRNGKPAVRV